MRNNVVAIKCINNIIGDIPACTSSFCPPPPPPPTRLAINKYTFALSIIAPVECGLDCMLVGWLVGWLAARTGPGRAKEIISILVGCLIHSLAIHASTGEVQVGR